MFPSHDPEAGLAAAAEGQEIESTVGPGSESGGIMGGVVKAYVVAEEMTTQQEADAKINDLARL